MIEIVSTITEADSKAIQNMEAEPYTGIKTHHSLRSRRSAFLRLSWTRNENYGIVFVYSNEFSNQEVAVIKSAAEEIAKFACFPINVFSNAKYASVGGNVQRIFHNHVFISRNQYSGCNADIGMLGGRQRLNLDPWLGCALRKGTVMHEMIHSLGNSFVRVHFENILPGEQYNFQVKPNAIALGPYDYHSIMHYPDSSYARNPRYSTISSTLRGYSVPHYPLTTLSQTDKDKIRAITGCKSTTLF
ncbi:High choriolytic enzyme 1 [Folsomia candida]|uniref:Metalloendopeptidase n=1 Tax=Folsomia candida TaxID=158441 RepID=A0A226EL78_FOLCA|nr:High choriolytic enzyme 1 [Folsomia candida]